MQKIRMGKKETEKSHAEKSTNPKVGSLQNQQN